MIHEDLSSGAKKKTEVVDVEVDRHRPSVRGFRNTRFFGSHLESFNSFTDDTIRRSIYIKRERERKEILYAVNVRHVLPVHVVLELHLYWTVPRRLILVVVFILRYLCKKGEETKDETMKIVCCIRV